MTTKATTRKDSTRMVEIPLSYLTQLQSNKSQYTNDHMSLLFDMQKLLSLKFDNLEQTITKLSKENQLLRTTVEQLETKSELILDQVDMLCASIIDKPDIKHYDNMQDNTESAQNKQFQFPFDMILGKLSEQLPNNDGVNDDFEDEEYDANAKIYSDQEETLEDVEQYEKVPTNISELLEFGLTCTETIKNYNCQLDLKKIANLVKPLTKLNNMVGMTHVKNSVFEMILYYLQGFESKNQNMLHSVIEGPPGTGKTQLGKILTQIYCALGIIDSVKFKYVKATDLIGDYVGATKHKTQKVIDDADGGVLFIDEVYSLSTSEDKDPYGRECIDTLNFNLSEKKKKLIVIVAGYPDQLDKNFFSYNPGLQGRFPFRHSIQGYSSEELRDIFIDKLRRFEWQLDSNLNMNELTNFFKTNKELFTNFGRDVENLFKKCQYAHSNRVFGKSSVVRKKLNIEDIQNGLKNFKDSKRKNESTSKYPYLYT